MTNDARAKYYLRFWYNSAVKYPANFAMSFEEFLTFIQKTSPTWFSNFGAAALTAESSVSTDAIAAAMQNIANAGQGKTTLYPDGSFKGSEFFDALFNKVQKWDFKRIVTTTGQIVAKGAEAVASAGVFALSAYAIAGAIGLGFGVYVLLKNSRSGA